jgi:hypothetical protein
MEPEFCGFVEDTRYTCDQLSAGVFRARKLVWKIKWISVIAGRMHGQFVHGLCK